MQAIIVAGGRGERLRPLTNFKPKPMVEVAGKPILLHTLELLKAAGITEFIFALCYLPEVIKSYFGDGTQFGVSIEYTLEDPAHPLGTAGAIVPARENIRDTFIVTYADILRELDVAKMIKAHKQAHALATINVYKRYGAQPKSKVIFDNSYKIEQFIERPSETLDDKGFVWCNGSFYIFEPAVFDSIPKSGHADFGTDIFPALLKQEKPIYAFPSEGKFIDIGTKEKLDQATLLFT